MICKKRMDIAFFNFKWVYIFFSLRIDNWFSRISFPALQGWSLIKQWMNITSDQSVARFIASTLEDRFKELVLKYFLIISGVIFLHASRIHFVTVKLEILKRKSALKVECLKILKNKIIKMSGTVIVNLCVQGGDNMFIIIT